MFGVDLLLRICVKPGKVEEQSDGRVRDDGGGGAVLPDRGTGAAGEDMPRMVCVDFAAESWEPIFTRMTAVLAERGGDAARWECLSADLTRPLGSDENRHLSAHSDLDVVSQGNPRQSALPLTTPPR